MNQTPANLKTVTVMVNEQPIKLSADRSLASMLDGLDLRGGPIAVELNQELVPGDRHDSVLLQDGDQLEVVSLTGGG